MGTLKPCPFCGGEAMLFHIPENTPDEMEEHPMWRWNNPGWWVVGCYYKHECFLNFNHKSVIFETEKDAIEAWNRRVEGDDKRRTAGLGSEDD